MNPDRLIRSRLDVPSLRRAAASGDARKARFRSSQALRLGITALVDRAATVGRDLGRLMDAGDMDGARMAASAAIDLALTIASAVPRDGREAALKVACLRAHRLAFDARWTALPAMFDAAIAHEITRWTARREDPAAGGTADLG